MLIVEIFSIILLSYILILQVIKYAKSLRFLDVPNERSHHCDIVPSGAGLGFIATFFIATIIFEFQLFIQNWYIFLAIFLVFIVGIVDDRYEVSAKLKFIVIFISVILLWFYGIGIDSIGTWFGYQINLIWWIALPFTMFALAGFTNALNLIDGIDGLAATITIIILIFFTLIGIEYKNDLMIIVASFTIASLIGFLFLNLNPAKIFMGDSGSLTLGFIISLLAVESIKYIHPIVILYLAALPILDTLIVMVRRIRRGKSPFTPDKTHIHHILFKFFDCNVNKTVIFLSIMQIVFSSLGYMFISIIINDENNIVPALALIGFGMLFILFYMIFTGIKKRQTALDRIK